MPARPSWVYDRGDLERLDRRVAALSGEAVGYLPGLIDQARAAVAGRAFRARGIDRIDVPRADVEVDVDMENCEAGVYLWGTLTEGVPHGGYEPFVTWDPLDRAAEGEVFARLLGLAPPAPPGDEAGGGTFAAYCNSSAEATQMRRIAGGTERGPSLDEVESFTASPELG